MSCSMTRSKMAAYGNMMQLKVLSIGLANGISVFVPRSTCRYRLNDVLVLQIVGVISGTIISALAPEYDRSLLECLLRWSRYLKTRHSIQRIIQLCPSSFVSLSIRSELYSSLVSGLASR